MLQCAHAPMGISSRFPMACLPSTIPLSLTLSLPRSTEGNEKLMKLDLNFFGESLGLAPRGRRLVAIEAVLTDGGMDSDSSLAHVEAITTRGKEKKEEEVARIKPSASVHFQACGCFTDPGRIWRGAEE